MGVGQLSESDAVDALRLPFYSSSHPTGSHGWRNQFDLGNPDQYVPDVYCPGCGYEIQLEKRTYSFYNGAIRCRACQGLFQVRTGDRAYMVGEHQGKVQPTGESFLSDTPFPGVSWAPLREGRSVVYRSSLVWYGKALRHTVFRRCPDSC